MQDGRNNGLGLIVTRALCAASLMAAACLFASCGGRAVATERATEQAFATALAEPVREPNMARGAEPFLAAGGSEAGLPALSSGLKEVDAVTRVGLAEGVSQSPKGLPAGNSVAAVISRVTSGYGQRTDPFTGEVGFHSGIDIAVPVGTEVRPFKAGRVTFVGWESGYGLLVAVTHPDGLVTRYGHLSQALVSLHKEVGVGEVIALSGKSGRATGPHLHFEARRHGRVVDPLSEVD